MNRQQLIDSVVAYMQPFMNADVECVRMPDSSKDMRQPINKGRITVGHDDEEINYLKDVATVNHDVKVGVAIELRSKYLYDAKGIYYMMDLLDKKLLGVKFGQFKPLAYKTGLKFIDLDDEYWVYLVVMTTETKVVQTAGLNEPVLFVGIPTITS